MESDQYTLSLSSYIDSLQSHIEYLKKVQAPVFKKIPVDCTQMNEDSNYWKKELENIGINKDSSVLYYLSFDGDNAQLIRNTAEQRKSETSKKHKLALPQINKKNLSNILYVGKCNNNFPTRLKYHLGLGGSSTYALNLKHWATNWNFDLHIASIDFLDRETEIQYLEQMETALHYSLKPLLGRSGH